MTARDTHLESWSQQLGHLMANLRGVQEDLHMLKVEVDQSTKAEHADTFTPDIEVDLIAAMDHARDYLRNGYIDTAYAVLTSAIEAAKATEVLKQRTEDHHVDCLCKDCNALDDLPFTRADAEPITLTDEPVAIFEGTVAIGEGLPYRGNGRIKKLKFIPVGAELYLKRGAA